MLLGSSRPARRLGLLLLLSAIAACFLWQGPERAPQAGLVWRYSLRGGVVVFSLLAWFLTQSLIGERRPPSNGLRDLLHVWTAPWNRYLHAHPRSANATLVISSAVIDLMGVGLIAASVFGPSVRPFVALIILMLMRQACQAGCVLPPPPGIIWRHPGVPSLLVTYHVGGDFFFSAHTGIAVLCAIEVAGMCVWWQALAVGLLAVFQSGVVIVLRAHYTMDVFAAAVAAFCAARLSEWLV